MMDFIERIVHAIPLELFSFVGSFLEEIIAPIPSPLIMTSAGLVAQERGYGWLAIFMLAVIGAVGKTIASWIVYVIADRFEDVLLVKYGKYIGVSHSQLEHIGKMFSKGWWDDVIIFLLRAVPLVPTFFVSIASGMIKMNMRTFIVATFFGTIVRNMGYIIVGLYGTQSFSFVLQLAQENLQVAVFLSILALIAGGGLLFFRKKIVSKFFHPTVKK